MFNEDSSPVFVWDVPLVTLVLRPEFILMPHQESASETRHPVSSGPLKSPLSPSVTPTLKSRQLCLTPSSRNHFLPRYQEGLSSSPACIRQEANYSPWPNTAKWLLFSVCFCLFVWGCLVILVAYKLRMIFELFWQNRRIITLLQCMKIF